MSESERPEPGTIIWTDLTVPDAERIRDFYGEVVGWSASPVGMGDYDDFSMCAANGNPVAGVCHARGTNAGLPPVWMIYVSVEDLDRRVERCTALGGEVVVPPKGMGQHGRYAVIRDPAGATLAIFEPASGEA